MRDELGRIRKEAAVAYWRYYMGIYLGGPRKTRKHLSLNSQYFESCTFRTRTYSVIAMLTCSLEHCWIATRSFRPALRTSCRVGRSHVQSLHAKSSSIQAAEMKGDGGQAAFQRVGISGGTAELAATAFCCISRGGILFYDDNRYGPGCCSSNPLHSCSELFVTLPFSAR
jgi:hypothetical protein